MSLTVQNLRAVGTGVEPASLLPGQIAFNLTDKVLYVGDGSNFKTAFDGTQVAGVPGEGWYAMPMDFSSLGDYYVANPGYWGDVPTDQQVLTWSTALNHPIWTNGGGGGGGSQVYVVTNAAVASAPGATTSDKISAAIGVVSPDEGDVTIVTGLPNDVYEGLYFFTTEWVKGAAYAYPSASEVIYDNTAHPSLTPTVQGAIDDLDDGLTATTAIANTANSTATSALSIANAALPKAGGTMTGTIVSRNINVQSGYSVQFDGGVSGTLNGISDSTSSSSSSVAASSAAVRSAYLLAQAALPYSGGAMTGTITFAAGQVFPISGIDIASTSQLGVVQVGTNINVTGAGVISVDSATTSTPGIVQLNNTTTSTSTTQALTAAAGANLQGQINSLTVASNTKLAGSINCSSGLIDSVTTDGTGIGLVVGSPLPAPAAGNANYYVIVTTGSASFSPPGGGGPYAPENGDWFLSNGTAWQYLGVGARPSYASTTTAGIVQLATNSDTQAGTNNTLAVTPAGLQSKVSDSTSTTSSTTIASSTAVKSAYDLANAALPKAGGTMTGDLTFSGTGVGVVFNDASTVEAISDSTSTTSSVTAASSTAVKSAYDLGAAALPKAGGTMTGAITFAAGQVFPVSGIQDATIGQKGVVQIGNNIQVASGTISVNTATTGQLGVVQVGSNIDVTSGTISVKSASTAQAGIVQLNDTTTSTSTTQALTANQGKLLQDQINALSVTSNITFAGTINGGTGNMLTVTAEGATVGFTVGSPLPSPSSTIAEFFVIVSVAGTMTPPGGSATAVQVGDWWLASASTWTYVAAGYTPVTASTTTAGIVQLATNAEVQSGVNSTKAVVPSALQSKISDSTSTTSSTTIASSTAVKSAYDLANAAVPKACYTALGALVTGTGSGTIGTLSSGTNGQFLAVNTACSSGLQWCTLSLACVPCSAFTACGSLLVGTGASTFTALPPGTNGQTLLVDTACNTTGGLKWGNALAGYTCTATPFNTALGFQAGDSITTGTDNVAIGYNAGTAQAAGSQSVFIGSGAGQSADAVGVTAIGFCAGQALTTASCSTYLGYVSGRNATGLSNTYVGSLTGCAASNTSTCGVLLGFCAGSALTTGSANNFIGFQAGRFVTTGGFNVAVGTASFQTATTAANNVAIGCGALAGLSTSCGNVAVGHRAMINASTAADNVVIGCGAGTQILTGTCNVAMGFSALNAAATSGNVAIGAFAGAATTSGNNTLVGYCAGASLTNTSMNVFIGYLAGRSVQTGQGNIGIGCGAMTANNAGSNNIAIGFSAGEAMLVAGNNTFVGPYAGRSVTTGSSNVFLGFYSGSATQSNNIVFADGSGNVRQQFNSSGALNFDGTNYGTAGQVLQSNGSAAAPTWTTPVVQPLTALTTTSTAVTTLLSVSASTFRGVIINLSVSDATGGNYKTDIIQVVQNGTTANVQTTSGATLGSSPYTVSAAVTAGNLVVSVTSTSTNSTKYVGSYQTFAI